MKKTYTLSFLMFLYISGFGQTYPVVEQADTVVEKWDVFEITIRDSGTLYANPFWDVTINSQFTSPGGTNFMASGFYYDSSLWKLRFSPTDTGNWSYTLSFTGGTGTKNFTGSFRCTPSAADNHGFIHINPAAKHKFIQDDGTPFIPIGTNGNCPSVTAALLGISVGPSQVTSMWDSLEANGINTYRLFMYHQPAFTDVNTWNTEEGFANLLYNTPSLDRYNYFSCKLIDRWFKQTKDKNIAIYLCLMQIFDISAYPFNTSPWYKGNGGPYNLPNDMYKDGKGAGSVFQKKYIQYVVSRWGAYRNLVTWEYNNEYGSETSYPWLIMMDSVIKAHDHYNRPHTVSFWHYGWSKNAAWVNASSYLTVTDDHLYKYTGPWTEFNGDSAANQQARFRYTQYNKPVMFSEFSSGVGYTASDALFQRIAYWGAFTGGGLPLFWQDGENNSAGWAYNTNNLHFLSGVNKVLSYLPRYDKMAPDNARASTDKPSTVRTYCLSDSSEHLIYMHHFTNHTTVVSNAQLTFTTSTPLNYYYTVLFLDPFTGDTIQTTSGISNSGACLVTVPDFVVDILACIVLDSITPGIADQNIHKKNSSVYPNPFEDRINFDFGTLNSVLNFKLIDLLGKQLFSTKISNNSSLNLKEIITSPGIYFYEITGKGLNIPITGKLIRE